MNCINMYTKAMYNPKKHINIKFFPLPMQLTKLLWLILFVIWWTLQLLTMIIRNVKITSIVVKKHSFEMLFQKISFFFHFVSLMQIRSTSTLFPGVSLQRRNIAKREEIVKLIFLTNTSSSLWKMTRDWKK